MVFAFCISFESLLLLFSIILACKDYKKGKGAVIQGVGVNIGGASPSKGNKISPAEELL